METAINYDKTQIMIFCNPKVVASSVFMETVSSL